MATKDYMEGSVITLAVTLKSGVGKDAQATFTFKVVDHADKELTTLPPGFDKTKQVKVDIEKRALSVLKAKASATVQITAPKVEAFSKDKIPNYTISYTYKVDGDPADSDGASKYRIWPKKIKVTAYKKGTTTANPKMQMQVSGVKDSDRTTDDKGVALFDAREKKLTEIEELPGFRIVKWLDGKDKGVERECEIEKDYKCVILSPEKPKKGNYIRYVNLEAKTGGPKEFGQLVEFEVTGEGDKDRPLAEKHATKDDEIFVYCKFSKESKRDDPVPELKADGVEELKKASKDTVYTGKVKVGADGIAKFKVELGNAGGETCEVKVGTNKTWMDDSIKIENWRRLYYQVSRPDSGSAPDITVFVDAMKSVKIECVALPEVTLTSGGNPIPVWMDGKHLGKTDGTKYLLAGDTKTNKGTYEALLVTGVSPTGSTEVPPADLIAHFLFCDEQVDFTNVPDLTVQDCLQYPTFAALDTETVDMDLDGSGTLVASDVPTKLTITPKPAGTHFYAVDSSGNSPVRGLDWTIGGEQGSFDPGDITVTYAGDAPTIEVDTSGNNAFREAYAKRGAEKVNVSLACQKSAHYNGEAFGDKGRHLLISSRFATRPASEQCGTMAHELGHALKMAVSDGYSVSGMDDPQKKHGRHYSRLGNHCADGLSESDYKKYSKIADFGWQAYVETGKDGSKKVKDLTAECKCCMYGIGHAGRKGYCNRCKPYFIALDIKKFG